MSHRGRRRWRLRLAVPGTAGTGGERDGRSSRRHRTRPVRRGGADRRALGAAAQGRRGFTTRRGFPSTCGGRRESAPDDRRAAADTADTAGTAGTAGIDLDADGWWEHPGLLDRLREAVDDANGLVSRAESIRRIRVLPGQFTIDAGHLTPSMKLRRAQIEAAFAAEIEELYAAAPPAAASVSATVPAAASTPA